MWRKIFIWIIVMLAIIWANSAWAESFSSLNKKGNKAYQEAAGLSEKGKKNEALEAYERALKYYRDAEIEKPESPPLSYNIGNVNYQQEKYEDALDKYYRALSVDEPRYQAATYYNMGNALYRAGKYPEAIQTYQKCLDINPDDEDAKYNLEFVRKKMKEMLDKEAQRQQKQQPQQQQQQQQEQQEQNSQQQEQNQQPEEKQQQQAQPQDQQEKQEQKQEQMQPKEGMTKEDAERILNALKDDEKDILKKQQRSPQSRGRRGGKDW